MRGYQLAVSAARAMVTDMLRNFYFGKNHKIANNSATTGARVQKLESSES